MRQFLLHSYSCLTNKIQFEKFVLFHQICIQIVPLCDYNNNIRKQVHMTFEHGLFNKLVKITFMLQRDLF